MEIVVGVFRAVVGALLAPFHGAPAWVPVTVVSLITAILMLLVVKATSNQKKIAAVKRKIHAGLFEIRLFNDDLGAIMRAQGDILKSNLAYVGLSFVPLFWMIIPLTLLIAQLQFHLGYRGLEPGTSTVFKVVMKDEPATAAARNTSPSVNLDVPAGLRLDTPGVWIPGEREIAWRLTALDPGEHIVQVTLQGREPVAKTVHVGDDVARRSPARYVAGFKNQLLEPAEPPIPATSAFSKISLRYPDAEVSFFGWKAHWLIPFFLLSIVFAFILKGAFKVDI